MADSSGSSGEDLLVSLSVSGVSWHSLVCTHTAPTLPLPSPLLLLCVSTGTEMGAYANLVRPHCN